METRWGKLGTLCDVFVQKECLNYFMHAGYKKITVQITALAEEFSIQNVFETQYGL